MQQEWFDKGKKYLANTYTRFPIGIAKGEGCWLWDMTGRRYLDFLSGIAVCNLGHANKAVVEVENYLYATSQLAQTTLRSVIGQMELDELLAQRDKINIQLQDILDKHTEPWGIKVSLVETKQVDLPDEMRRAIARQAEAEREKRAKIIHAEGEYQAAEKLAQAANVISVNPAALQLRFLQTLTEIATEKNSTTIFPVPIDIITPFLKKQ